MKTSFITGSLILAFLASCNNEQLAAVSYQSGKSPDVVNFEKAIKSLWNSENRETPEEKIQRGNFPYANTIVAWTNVSNNSPYNPLDENDAQVQNTVWDRVDFELNDSNNYNASSPLTGSVGFVSSCISTNASVINGSGTLNGNNYDFVAHAFTMGGDYWVIVK